MRDAAIEGQAIAKSGLARLQTKAQGLESAVKAAHGAIQSATRPLVEDVLGAIARELDEAESLATELRARLAWS